MHKVTNPVLLGTLDVYQSQEEDESFEKAEPMKVRVIQKGEKIRVGNNWIPVIILEKNEGKDALDVDRWIPVRFSDIHEKSIVHLIAQSLSVHDDLAEERKKLTSIRRTLQAKSTITFGEVHLTMEDEVDRIATQYRDLRKSIQNVDAYILARIFAGEEFTTKDVEGVQRIVDFYKAMLET